MREQSAKVNIPIYDMKFELVVADDMIKAQKKEPRRTRLGNQKPVDCMGVLVFAKWNFCLILNINYIDHNLIAHESFHATHRLLDYCGVRFKVNNHEAFAYVNGFINAFVYSQLKKWNIRIK